MKRPTFLYWHLRGINRSVASERKRFFRLYPIALLVCGFSFGSVVQMDKNARGASLKPLPLSIPSTDNKTSPMAVYAPLKPISHGIEATWIGGTRSGEPIREDGSGVSFVW